MIEITNTETSGWEAAIRGARNPMNSWDKSDTHWVYHDDGRDPEYVIGDNDLALMKKLVAAGSDHSKFTRMINVTADIKAPLYWIAEFDTYKVGTVKNSCSFMHKGTSKPFSIDDFSTCGNTGVIWDLVLNTLNHLRDLYLDTKDDTIFQKIRCLLPCGYNQKFTVQLNYAVLRNIYHARKNHRLNEWRDFCHWIETLPYANELIIGDDETEREKI